MTLNHKQLVNRNGHEESKPQFTFIDLFAGIGGFRKAFDAIGGKCLFTSEWNRYALKTYVANFPVDENHAIAGDITQIKADDIPPMMS